MIIFIGCGEESSYLNLLSNVNNFNNIVVDNLENIMDDLSLYLVDMFKVEIVDNFCDIVGNSMLMNYVNVDGLKLRWGVIYWLNYLLLNEIDLEIFKILEIKIVYDLWINFEREKSLDILSFDINIMMVNIVGLKESDLLKGIVIVEDMINFFNSLMVNMVVYDKGI